MEFGLVALWLVLYLGLLLAGTTLTAAIFPRFADRGCGLAIPLAVALLWLVSYWVGRLSFGIAPWLGLVVLLALVAVVLYRRGFDGDRRLVAETAGVFTLAFLVMIAIRAVDPAVHPGGGEKFLDFGLLRSLLRSSTLPPEDMWFAGETVQYYYGGHLAAAILARFTGTEAKFAYNLAHAGFYAMLVTAAYGLAGSIAASNGSSRRFAGVAGAVLVGFASNLETPGRLLLWLLPGGVAQAVADVAQIEIDGVANGPASFGYWSASRVIEGTINEFPLFAWLNGDLHAHMTSTPFMLLLVGVLYSYYRTPEASVARRRALIFGLVPPIAAIITVVNTWSFPTTGGLTLLTLAFSPTRPATLLPQRVRGWSSGRARSWTAEVGRFASAAVGAIAVLALGVCWTFPFWLGTASSRGIAFFPERSPVGALFVVHGVFLTIFALYLTGNARRVISNPGRGVVMLTLFVLLAALSRVPIIALLGPFFVVAWVLLRSPSHRQSWRGSDTGDRVVTSDGGQATTETPGFETILFLGTVGLILLVEFAYVKENAGPERFNTVFKTYMQVWILLSVASGVALAHVRDWTRPSVLDRNWRLPIRVGLALLVVSTSFYGVLALSSHFGNDSQMKRVDDPTLNAVAFLETHHPDERAAIQWLDEHVEGQPTMVSAPGTKIYRWVNGPSSLTGVPTIAGWVHETGYREPDQYWSRVEDVNTIYTGNHQTQRRLLKKYDVTYIYVGPTERQRYETITVGDARDVRVAKDFGAVTIYRVE
jgi:YYY domain-containing protein